MCKNNEDDDGYNWWFIIFISKKKQKKNSNKNKKISGAKLNYSTQLIWTFNHFDFGFDKIVKKTKIWIAIDWFGLYKNKTKR